MEAQLKLGRSLSPAQPTEGEDDMYKDYYPVLSRLPALSNTQPKAALTVERVERLFDQNSIVNASEDTPVLMREDFIAIIAELKETP